MKYTPEITLELQQRYQTGEAVTSLAEWLQVPERSIIAKLSSLGCYKKKEYRNKMGEVPVKKEWFIEQIAQQLNTNIELLESLEKVNKRVLLLIHQALDQK